MEVKRYEGSIGQLIGWKGNEPVRPQKWGEVREEEDVNNNKVDRNEGH